MNSEAEQLNDVIVEAGTESKDRTKRFCGRCQQWVPDVVELHYCVKAPRAIGYAWYEPDEPAIEARKGVIVTDGRPFKHGALISEFPVEVRNNG